jgi:type I restriction enzyme, R subunit
MENIVFFKYVRSAISFYQMIGRGTRLNPATGKLMFRVYDYTNATRLFGEDFVTKEPSDAEPGVKQPEPGTTEKPPVIQVEGFEVMMSPAGRYFVTTVDGKAMPVTLEEYRERLSEKLVEEAPTLDEFRRQWIVPSIRRALLENLPDAGRSALVIQQLDEMTDFDLYDVLAELGYGLAPRTRSERAEAFFYKHHDWLERLPDPAEETLRALTRQFARGGTDALENPAVLDIPEVRTAGGLPALKELGKPVEILAETKKRIFAA